MTNYLEPMQPGMHKLWTFSEGMPSAELGTLNFKLETRNFSPIPLSAILFIFAAWK